MNKAPVILRHAEDGISFVELEGALPDGSDSLPIFRGMVNQTTGTSGLVLDLTKCMSIKEEGTGIILSLISTGAKIGIILGDKKSQPSNKFHTMKLDDPPNVQFFVSEEDAIAFITG